MVSCGPRPWHGLKLAFPSRDEGGRIVIHSGSLGAPLPGQLLKQLPKGMLSSHPRKSPGRAPPSASLSWRTAKVPIQGGVESQAAFLLPSSHFSVTPRGPVTARSRVGLKGLCRGPLHPCPSLSVSPSSTASLWWSLLSPSSRNPVVNFGTRKPHWDNPRRSRRGAKGSPEQRRPLPRNSQMAEGHLGLLIHPQRSPQAPLAHTGCR